MNEILTHGRHLTGPLLSALDLLGTFVFALSGAAAGVKSRLDLFGLMVLAFAAGNAGGISRDLLIGAVPPAAIANWSYVGVSVLAGFAVFFWYPTVARHPLFRLALYGHPAWLASPRGLAAARATHGIKGAGWKARPAELLIGVSSRDCHLLPPGLRLGRELPKPLASKRLACRI